MEAFTLARVCARPPWWELGLGGLTVTGALGARVVARIAVPDTAVGAGGVLTALSPAQGWASLMTFVHV